MVTFLVGQDAEPFTCRREVAVASSPVLASHFTANTSSLKGPTSTCTLRSTTPAAFAIFMQYIHSAPDPDGTRDLPELPERPGVVSALFELWYLAEDLRVKGLQRETIIDLLRRSWEVTPSLDWLREEDRVEGAQNRPLTRLVVGFWIYVVRLLENRTAHGMAMEELPRWMLVEIICQREKISRWLDPTLFGYVMAGED